MRYSGILVAILPVAVRGAIPLSEQRPLIARVDQPYSWSLSPLTFSDADTPYISLRNAPDWLIYDNATSTFRGRPSTKDVGVTTLYSLFPACGFLRNGPLALASMEIHNGLPLPDWVAFNNWTMTFDGVAPPENRPVALPILLHGSDRWGFRAINQQFELVVGARTHLLGIDGTSGLETVNVTGGVPFTHSIQTFGGLTIDGVQVVSANVSRVEVNVSSVPWVTFDNTTRTLAGLPPVSAIGYPPCILPVLITSDYNDTVATNLSIATFPSYFNTAFIQPLNVSSGSFLTFSTQPYFSHARSSLAVVVPRIIPRAAASWLSYNSANDTLSGLVPRSAYNEVNVTFYATDLETHAVSAVSMLLSIASNETLDPGAWDRPHGSNHGVQARTAIIATFSVLGGAVLLCCLLALCRRYCGPHDLEGDDENVNQWKSHDLAVHSTHWGLFSEKIMRSLGRSRSSSTTDGLDDAYKSSTSLEQPRPRIDPTGKTTKKVHFFRDLVTPPRRKLWAQSKELQSGNIRRSQISRPTPINDEGTLAQMSIAYTEGGSRSDIFASSGEPVADYFGLDNAIPSSAWSKAGRSMRGPGAPPLEGLAQVTSDRSSQTPSASDGSSLTSIPRRRSDFLPPRHQRVTMPDQVRGDTIDSIATSGSSNLDHADGAVIATAARQKIPTTISTPSVSRTATRASLESGISTVLNKHQSLPGSPGSVSVTGIRRPRLVHLNKEHRAPVVPNTELSITRKFSQKAVPKSLHNGHSTQTAGDIVSDQRLSLGLHYVTGLGGDEDDSESAVFYLTPSVGKAPSPTVGTCAPDGAGPSGTCPTSNPVLDKGESQTAGRLKAKRIPVGAPFVVSIEFETIPARGADLLIRQQDGRPAPGWINLDQRDVELWGVPLREHRGIHMLEIVECLESRQRVVARMNFEVVNWE
ncbi:transmembrane protein [Ceratobasidium sp. AG-Ba]|nr:transmembrane protein [Ceratobasidium sp. AG-Ba]